MQLEQEIVLILQTERTNIARAWQTEARAHWPNRARADFGRGTDVYKTVAATISALEVEFRVSMELLESSSAICFEKDTAAIVEDIGSRWAALPYSWPDIQTMIRLIAKCVDDTFRQAGVAAPAGLLCSQALASISGAASRDRVLGLEQELATIREQAVLSQHLAGRFISNASHDLRTPLTAILGFAELLMEETYGELAGDQADAVGHVYNSAQNLLEIVNNLLDIMQIQAGKLNLRCKRVEVAPMLTSVYDLLRSLAERRNVNFTIDVSNELGEMNMDENIVRHIVYHLLASALRSTPTGGKVALSAKRTPGAVTIITHDTALKLPQEAIDSMLGVVPLLENSPVRGYDGWEVGLALVRRYVELHQGTMEIDNRNFEGTTFLVTLPAGLATISSRIAPLPLGEAG